MNDVQLRLWGAQFLIYDINTWTQCALARDKTNAPTAPGSDKACCWCAMGAVVDGVVDVGPIVLGTWDHEKLVVQRCNALLDIAAWHLFSKNFVFINDNDERFPHKAHEKIMQIYELAQELATDERMGDPSVSLVTDGKGGHAWPTTIPVKPRSLNSMTLHSSFIG